jgi:diguanylate cyclase (GGDEF)-like protein
VDSDTTRQARQRELAHAIASATNGAAKERSPEQAENGNGRFVRSEERGGASLERAGAIRLRAERERLEIEDLRDRLASERDKAAEERDGLAAQRDHDAAVCDREALELDGRERLFDRHTLRVQELRSRAAVSRRRAADDRRRAAADRRLAARDREQAAHDRADARRDREQAARARELAGIDELTGARRRGVGLEELQREIERARRTNGRLVAAFVDVDDLKSVNDEHGHRAGDQLLRDVAAGLASRMRSYDLVVRVGGDEFLCALPDVTPTEARRRFDELVSVLDEGPTVRSVSFGLSELRDGDSLEELIDRADRDLMADRSRQRSWTPRRGVNARLSASGRTWG